MPINKPDNPFDNYHAVIVGIVHRPLQTKAGENNLPDLWQQDMSSRYLLVAKGCRWGHWSWRTAYQIRRCINQPKHGVAISLPCLFMNFLMIFRSKELLWFSRFKIPKPPSSLGLQTRAQALMSSPERHAFYIYQKKNVTPFFSLMQLIEKVV